MGHNVVCISSQDGAGAQEAAQLVAARVNRHAASLALAEREDVLRVLLTAPPERAARLIVQAAGGRAAAQATVA